MSSFEKGSVPSACVSGHQTVQTSLAENTGAVTTILSQGQWLDQLELTDESIIGSIWYEGSANDDDGPATIDGFSGRQTLPDNGRQTSPYRRDRRYHLLYYQRQRESSCSDDGQLVLSPWQRFSAPSFNGCSRYFNCNYSELPDLTAWLVWHHSEIERSLYRNSNVDAVADHCVSASSWRDCQEILLFTLQGCTADQLPTLLLSLCCVLTAFRRMHISELFSFVTMAFGTQQYINDKRQTVQAPNSALELMTLCKPLLRLNSKGFAEFRHHHMQQFLHRVNLPGLDRSHNQITRICLQHIKSFGTNLILRPWHNFRTWLKDPKRWPLHQYVCDYWFQHFRVAEDHNNPIMSELHSMITSVVTGSADQSFAQLSMQTQRCITNFGSAICDLFEFSKLKAVYESMGSEFCASRRLLVSPMPSEKHWKRLRLKTSIIMPLSCRSIGQERMDKQPLDNHSDLNTISAVASNLANMRFEKNRKTEPNLALEPSKRPYPGSDHDSDWDFVSEGEAREIT